MRILETQHHDPPWVFKFFFSFTSKENKAGRFSPMTWEDGRVFLQKVSSHSGFDSDKWAWLQKIPDG